MTITSVRLVDGPRSLQLLPSDELQVQGLDVPFPAVRAVAEDRTDSDGSEDTTTRHGARACSLRLQLTDRLSGLVDEINGYLHPRSRPYLVVGDDEWATERRLRLRVDQQSAPLEADSSPIYRAAQVQWVVPDGVWESVESVSFRINADVSDLRGRTYPLVYPRRYPVTNAAGALGVVNPGNTWQHYVALLYGPCAGPRLTDEHTGRSIVFTEALTIPAGEYVEVDTAARTAYYLSDPAATRLNLIDFEQTTWWQLAPGPSRIRYHPVSGVEAGCVADIEYHPAWL